MRTVSEQGRQNPLSAEPGFAFCPACGGPLPSPRPVTCDRCGQTHYRNAKPCAGALVMHGDRLLLVRRAKAPFAGWWDIPGGFCNPTELPRDGAAREVFEETGLQIAITGLLGMWIDRYHEGGTTQDTLNIYFTATVSGGLQTTVDPVEVTEVGWFQRDALPTDVAFPDHASAVLDAWRAGFGD